MGIAHAGVEIVQAVEGHVLGHDAELAFLGAAGHVDADLAAFLFQHFPAELYGAHALLGTDVVLYAVAGPGGLDDLEPVPVGIAGRIGDDFDGIPVLQGTA